MNRFVFCLLTVFLVGTASATVPHVFNYQGYLTDLNDTPLDGTYELVFRIYNARAGSNPALWTEAHNQVDVAEGVFSVLLGSVVDLPEAVLAEDALWIGVTVGTDSEIAPRLQVTSTPWAYRAAIADSAVVSGNGGGDGGVVRIDTGAGLTGGPITRSGVLSVADEGISGDMLAPDAVDSDHVADNSIFAVDLFDEPGVAADRNGSTLVLQVDVAENVSSKQIYHPGSGYIVAMATSTVYINHDTSFSSMVFFGVSTTSEEFDHSNTVTIARSHQAASGSYFYSAATNDVFPVSGAGIATFYLVAEAERGEGHHVEGANLVLMYFPTAYGTISKGESGSEVLGE